MSTKEQFTKYIYDLQNEICSALENEDGKAKFIQDRWERPGGGGGQTRVIKDGAVFEKGGVNVSEVHGELPELMQKQLGVSGSQFFACGLSLVIHPYSPMVPTVHANFRYFEMYDDEGKVTDHWFGGGIDLTPYYLREEDAISFHKGLKEICDNHHESLYPKYKKECDEYFFNAHRNEARGIGGLFFDYLKPNDTFNTEQWMNFVMDTGKGFVPSYIPIVQRRKNEPYNEDHKHWQEIRRGRYVEFNLIHDKGTIFGLKTNGRIESILMSLPATVRWEYNHHPEEGSPEFELLEGLKPRDWASMEIQNA